MGDVLTKLHLSKEALGVANQLRNTFNQAGLAVSVNVIHRDGAVVEATNFLPSQNGHETLSMTVTNPATGQSKNVEVQNVAVAADGYMDIGNAIKVNNAEARFLPTPGDKDAEKMGGPKTNTTRKVAKNIINSLKT